MNRVGGINGILLLITAALGFAGIFFSLTPVPAKRDFPVSQGSIVMASVAAYIVLMLVTMGVFHRVVTTELVLITGWTVLEAAVVDRLYAAGALSGSGVLVEGVVIAAAFLISIVLYVAYYRMEEMKAFYYAMVPLVTEAAAMGVLTGLVLSGKSW